MAVAAGSTLYMYVQHSSLQEGEESVMSNVVTVAHMHGATTSYSLILLPRYLMTASGIST